MACSSVATRLLPSRSSGIERPSPNSSRARCPSDREDVVQAHHDIGENDRPDGSTERFGGVEPDILGIMPRHDQADRDEDQEQAADRLQQRDIQQQRGEHREEDAQANRAHAAPDDRLAPVVVIEVARRHADDDRVVPGKHQVKHDDAEDPLQGIEFHSGQAL
jgi:hypothetical protein